MTTSVDRDRLKAIKNPKPMTLRDIGVLDSIESLRHRETYRQPWHVHRAAMEIHCVFSGAITYAFGDAHPKETIAGGECLVIPPGVRHCAVSAEGTPSVRLVVRLRGADRITAALCPFTCAEGRAFHAELMRHALRVWTLPVRALRAARELHRCFEADEATSIRRLAFWTFLAETARAVADAPTSSRHAENAPQAVVDWVCAHLRDHLHERLRLKDLSKHIGYSERHLLNLFRTRTGMTIIRYLTRLRIDRARELIAADPARPLTDVALACGFSNHAHFTHVFHRYIGETPRAFSHTLKTSNAPAREDQRETDRSARARRAAAG